jgi:AraC family transcriptional regulator of adaptative response/methylated-DNA-[protein]-cysteine methyltransferase
VLITQRIETPIGPMRTVVRDDGLLMCEYDNPSRLPTQLARFRSVFGADAVPGEHVLIDQTREELNEYFAGSREAFTIPLVLEGTPFQTSVWRALLDIPFGATTSYESIATRIGRPGAARAVGRANGDNRIAIIVPCHRVIGADGNLTGYGGGQHRKRRLLDLEQRGMQMSFLAPDGDDGSLPLVDLGGYHGQDGH